MYILKGHKKFNNLCVPLLKIQWRIRRHLSYIKTLGFPVPYPNSFSVLPFFLKKLCALSLVHKLLNLTTTIKKSFCVSSSILKWEKGDILNASLVSNLCCLRYLRHVLELKRCCLQKITLSPCSTSCHLGFELLGLFAIYFIFHEYLTRALQAPEDYRSSYLKTYTSASLCVM